MENKVIIFIKDYDVGVPVFNILYHREPIKRSAYGLGNDKISHHLTWLYVNKCLHKTPVLIKERVLSWKTETSWLLTIVQSSYYNVGPNVSLSNESKRAGNINTANIKSTNTEQK